MSTISVPDIFIGVLSLGFLSVVFCLIASLCGFLLILAVPSLSFYIFEESMDITIHQRQVEMEELNEAAAFVSVALFGLWVVVGGSFCDYDVSCMLQLVGGFLTAAGSGIIIIKLVN